MANEDLIYQMTKTVLARLGPQADARLVEEMVADLYRLVDGAGTTSDVRHPRAIRLSERAHVARECDRRRN